MSSIELCVLQFLQVAISVCTNISHRATHTCSKDVQHSSAGMYKWVLPRLEAHDTHDTHSHLDCEYVASEKVLAASSLPSKHSYHSNQVQHSKETLECCYQILHHPTTGDIHLGTGSSYELVNL